MRLYLLDSNVDIYATQSEKYDLVISESKGEFKFEEIKNWLELRVKDMKG